MLLEMVEGLRGKSMRGVEGRKDGLRKGRRRRKDNRVEDIRVVVVVVGGGEVVTEMRS